MILLATSAALIGLVHTMSPGHWLPVVLTVKGRRWSMQKAVAGAATTASGHVIMSTILAVGSLLLGARLIPGFEEKIERDGALVLLAFGLIYGLVAYFRGGHTHTHAHDHDGEHRKIEALGEGAARPKNLGAFVFLFSLGLSPCVAVLPLFFEASTQGSLAAVLIMASFSVGVLTALILSTMLTVRGVMKLDHPILETYGDVITGLGVAAMGVVLYFLPL